MAHLRDEWLASDLEDPRLRNGTFEDDHWLGPADAEITIIAYGSYTCPCSVLVEGLFDEVRRRSAGVSLVHRHFFDPARSPDALQAALLVEAAALLDTFEPAHRWMLLHAAHAATLPPSQVATALGLDPWLFPQLVASPDIRRRVLRDLAGARLLGIGHGPAYLIAGEVYEGLWCEADIEEALDQARERHARSRRPTLPLGPVRACNEAPLPNESPSSDEEGAP
jgi:protein-disulfide isomerase